MLTERGIERQLRGIVAEVSLVQPDSLNLDADLTGAGVDSLSVLRAVAQVEESFGITIPDAAFERIRTLRTLIEIIHHEVAQGGELLHQ